MKKLAAEAICSWWPATVGNKEDSGFDFLTRAQHLRYAIILANQASQPRARQPFVLALPGWSCTNIQHTIWSKAHIDCGNDCR
jgi:hypothetical protein